VSGLFGGWRLCVGGRPHNGEIPGMTKSSW
jgi:ribosomal protein S14